MRDQFDVIETGPPSRRRWIGIAVLVALLAIPVIGFLASRDPEPELPIPTAEPSVPSLGTILSSPNALRPTAKVKAGMESLDVVFPHGVRAEVRYPSGLALDNLGSRPVQGGWIDGDFMLFRRLMAPYSGEVEITRGGQPIRSYAPNVTLWPRQPGTGAGGQVMMFKFGKWRIALYDRAEGLTFEQRVAWAEKLRGMVTKGGYLVLSASAPVRLAKPGESARGDPVGPQLWFGGGSGDIVALIPTPGCNERSRMPSDIGGVSRYARKVCRGEVLVAAAGEKAFVDQAVEKISVTLK